MQENAIHVSIPMDIPGPTDPPTPPTTLAEGLDLEALDRTSTIDTVTAPGAPVVGSPSDSPGSSPGGSPHAMRRRGRPRKGEEMSEEERKARRKEINRLAARRAHQKKMDILSKLESVKRQLRPANLALAASCARLHFWYATRKRALLIIITCSRPCRRKTPI